MATDIHVDDAMKALEDEQLQKEVRNIGMEDRNIYFCMHCSPPYDCPSPAAGFGAGRSGRAW